MISHYRAMIYASRMKERILYHACVANISYGNAVYHIAPAIYHCKIKNIYFFALCNNNPRTDYRQHSFRSVGGFSFFGTSDCKAGARPYDEENFLHYNGRNAVWQGNMEKVFLIVGASIARLLTTI